MLFPSAPTLSSGNRFCIYKVEFSTNRAAASLGSINHDILCWKEALQKQDFTKQDVAFREWGASPQGTCNTLMSETLVSLPRCVTHESVLGLGGDDKAVEAKDEQGRLWRSIWTEQHFGGSRGKKYGQSSTRTQKNKTRKQTNTTPTLTHTHTHARARGGGMVLLIDDWRGGAEGCLEAGV